MFVPSLLTNDGALQAAKKVKVNFNPFANENWIKMDSHLIVTLFLASSAPVTIADFPKNKSDSNDDSKKKKKNLDRIKFNFFVVTGSLAGL